MGSEGNMPRQIDLATFNSSGVRVYAGRDRGEAARRDARLADADAAGEAIVVLIPEDVFSINSSFFLGMFGDSIRLLGEDGFRRQYTFVGPGIDLVLEDGIREALRTSSPLLATGEHKARAKK
jgi:hypothetical protein